MTQDLYYIDEGYYDNGYFVYTADAESSVNSSFNIFAFANRIEETALLAFAESTLATSGERVRFGNSNINTTASISANATLIPGAYVNVSPNSNFSISIISERVKNASSALDSTVTQSANVERYRNSDSALSSQFSQAEDSTRLRQIGLMFYTFIEQHTQGSRVAGDTLTFTSSFTQSAMITHIHGSDLFAFTESQIAIQVNRIRDTNTDVSTNFSVAVTAVRGIFIQAQADAIVSIIANSNVIVLPAEAAIDAAFSLATNFTVRARTPVVINSEFSITANTLRNRSVMVMDPSQFAITINAVKNAQPENEIKFYNFANVNTSIVLLKRTTATFPTTVTFSGPTLLQIWPQVTWYENFSTVVPDNRARPTFDSTVRIGSTGASLRATTIPYQNFNSSNYIIQPTTPVIDNLKLYNRTIASTTGDWTIEFWLKATGFIGTSSVQWILGYYAGEAIRFGISTGQGIKALAYITNTIGTTYLIGSAAGSQGEFYAIDVGAITGDLRHFAIQRSGTNIRLFYNGVLVTYSSTTIQATDAFNIVPNLNFSRDTNLITHIDEVRVSNVARYGVGTTYTVPTGPLTRDVNTRLLTRFDNNLLSYNGLNQTTASLNSAATLSANAREFGIVPAEAAITSAFSINCSGTRVKRSDSSITSAFTQIASVNRQTNVNWDNSYVNAFTVIANAGRRTFNRIDCDSYFEFINLSRATKVANIYTEAIATEIVIVNRVGSVLVSCESSSTFQATANKTAGINLDINSQSTVLASVLITKETDAAVNCSSSQTANISVIRPGNSYLDSQFTQTATANRYASLDSSLETAVSLTAIPSYTKGVDSQLTITANTNLEFIRIRDYSSSLASNFSTVINTNNSLFKQLTAFVASLGEVTAVGNFTVSGSSQIQALGSQLTIGNEISGIGASLASEFSLTADAVKQQGFFVFYETVSTLDIDYSVVKETPALLTSQVSLAATARIAISLEASLAAQTIVNAVANRTRNVAITTQAIAIELVAVGAIRNNDTSLTARATMSVSGVKTSRGTSNLTSRFTINTNASDINVANLLAFTNASLSATISVIHIVDYLTYKVPSETRQYKIGGDRRTYTVGYEDREYSIREETRIHKIREETRNYKIPN